LRRESQWPKGPAWIETTAMQLASLYWDTVAVAERPCVGTGSMNHITLVETMRWSWNQFWKMTILGSIAGLIVGLIYALIVPMVSNGYVGERWLSFGITFAIMFGLVSGLVGGFTDTVKVDKASPNQGIKLSVRNSLIALLVTWLTAGLIFGLSYKPSYGTSFNLIVGLSFGLIGGLLVGLNRGGSAVIKHYALRLTLSRKGYMPLKLVKFLDQCARLILLKKVGGGYIFIHRMLLEYFAEISN
jgi:eukaryotic-like serine/threonine-protein kinase